MRSSFDTRRSFGTPMTMRQRDLQRLVPHVGTRARVPYQAAVNAFPNGQWVQNTEWPPEEKVWFGIPSGGVDWRVGRSQFGDLKPANRATTSANRADASANRANVSASTSLLPLNIASLVSDPKAAQTWLPVIGETLNRLLADDPRADYYTYQAKVKNLEQTIRMLPSFMRYPFEQRLRIVRARLKAAKEERALQIEGERATRTWRWVGWGASGTGIVVGLSAAALFLAMALGGGRR